MPHILYRELLIKKTVEVVLSSADDRMVLLESLSFNHEAGQALDLFIEELALLVLEHDSAQQKMKCARLANIFSATILTPNYEMPGAQYAALMKLKWKILALFSTTSYGDSNHLFLLIGHADNQGNVNINSTEQLKRYYLSTALSNIHKPFFDLITTIPKEISWPFVMGCYGEVCMDKTLDLANHPLPRMLANIGYHYSEDERDELALYLKVDLKQLEIPL